MKNDRRATEAMSSMYAVPRRRLVVLAVLLLGVGAGATPNECDAEAVPSPANDEPLVGRKPVDCSRRTPLGGDVPPECMPSTATAAPPGANPPPACPETNDNPCMRYHIQLVGDLKNAALRAKYVTAFGDACYVSEANTFDCWYKTWAKACEDAVLIGEVSGNASYDPGYTCQPDGVGNYWLQIGPNTANRTWIFLDNAPRQTPLIDVNGVPTEVNGPYRNLVDPSGIGVGNKFDLNSGVSNGKGGFLEQKDWVLAVNRKNNGGRIRSDLAGFTWPCEGVDGMMTTCTEPEFLEDPFDPVATKPNVHHVVPMKDPRCCPWGTNSYKNAAVVSQKLNNHFTNNDPPAEEVKWLNNAVAYTP